MVALEEDSPHLVVVHERSVVPAGFTQLVYSIDDLRKLFSQYRLFCWTHDEVKSLRITGMSTKRHKAGNDRQFRVAVAVADAERLFTWLAQTDPESAALIYSHYIDQQETADIAEAEQCSQRKVDYGINRGLRKMAEQSGWTG